MADGDSNGEGSNAPSAGRQEATNSGQRRPPIEPRRASVRFSEDVERAESERSPTEQSSTPNLRIDTNPETGTPIGITAQSSNTTRRSTSPLSPRARDRGYSLRRTLFARAISHQSDDNSIELTEAGPSRTEQNARKLEDVKKGHTGVSISPIPENDATGPPSVGGSSPSTFRKGRDKKSFGAIALPNYDVWAKKRSHKNAVVVKLKEYRKTVLDVVLRRKELQPSKDGRHIILDASRREDLIDERTGGVYCGNTIRSSRYTLWNFLPRQLFFQFSKLANAYFLLISILQLTGLGTLASYTTIAPLLVFVAISMAKEGYDDVRRYKLDQIENKKETLVFRAYRSAQSSKRHKTHFRSTRFKELMASKGRSRLPSRDLDKESRTTSYHEGGRDSQSFGTLKVWESLKWKDIKVGDIIKLERNDDVPADIVLLHATGPNGVAYIETMALDGETNLKSKQASPCLTTRCATIDDVALCRAHVVAEDPNIDLYNFDGRVMVDGETLPLTTNEIVFRGSTLRNTTYAIAMVINTGEDCKIRMNANKNPRIKTPAIQTTTNKIVIGLVFFVFLLSAFCTVGYQFWSKRTEDEAWYLEDATVSYAEIIIGFVILFNTLIPLSLYVSLEIIKVGQLILMTDVEMYDPISNTPMVCNTTTILENLGQVSYVFSDKTGTLTDNDMRFRKLSVAGYAWLHDFDLQKDAADLEQKIKDAERNKSKGKGVARHFQKTKRPSMQQDRRESSHTNVSLRRSNSLWRSSARPTKAQPEFRTEDLLRYMHHKPHSMFTKKAKFFLLSLALCHTCLPETKENGDIEFQAASPDELALVKAAQDLGWMVIDRPAQTIVLKYPGRSDSLEPITETYEVLDVIEFSSKRKRMSILVRFPNGKICIFCKGADSAILPRLRLAPMALDKVSEITRRSSKRKSVEAEEALRRLSEQSPRNSYNRSSMSPSRPSMNRKSTGAARPSMASGRRHSARNNLDSWLSERESEPEVVPDDMSAYESARSSFQRDSFTSGDRRYSAYEYAFDDEFIDDGVVLDESAVFDRCFQHIDDFATEGLRTLLYGYRFLDDQEYSTWKKVYGDATTSLVDRQNLIESAGEMIEQNFELAGATAIEDKLQKGVPETIDKLRRAHIKIWMLTGDKRETAINIAHSARLCKNYSEVIILDSTTGGVEHRMATALLDISNGNIAHSVIVVDGQTLAEINANESLALLFFDLAVIADSVICCRASPSQKASLVKQIRTKVKKSITLAIGDGANDIAMIQEAHVGIGVSGKEGLQAARISDYSIAQFRFLQRLLLIHGRWNYVRTGKYILATFWKELLFYTVQALYQRWNGYTGTSLFESTSITVFNTLFTSLAVIMLGMFEQDLEALTLLAVPELYSYGQQNQAFNFTKYFAWMFMASSEAMIIYFSMYGIFHMFDIQENGDLLSLGTLCFASAVIFINVKCLILEVHHKTIIPLAGCFISIAGWWVWTIGLSGLYSPSYKAAPLYHLSDGFLKQHGRDLAWWLVLIFIIASLTILELGVSSVRKTWWPTDTDVFQVLQKDPAVRARFQDVLDREESGGNGITNVDILAKEKRSGEEETRREEEIEVLLSRPRVMPVSSAAVNTSAGKDEVIRSPIEVEDGARLMTRRKTSVDVDRDDVEMSDSRIGTAI